MERNILVEQHKYLVLNAAARCYARYKKNNEISLDDMVNMGFIGLLEAADRFDGGQCNTFATYAFNRIRGSIIDETNKFIGIDKAKKYGITIVNMDEENIEEKVFIEQDTENEIYKKELLLYIDYAIEKYLTSQEKKAIKLKYKKGLNMPKISKEMGITKQSVNRLLNKAIVKIKRRMKLDAIKRVQI